jgi:CHRD domain
MKQYQSVLALVLFSLLSITFSQTIIAPVQRSSYQLIPVNTSGIAGTVYMVDYGMNITLIVVDMINADPSLSYPAHIHLGSCGSNGDVVVPLENINGATGLSITMTSATYEDISGGDHYINVHRPEDLSSIVACGEVGINTDAGQVLTLEPVDPTEPTAAPGTINQTGLAQGSELPTGVKPEEFATQMRTEGYGIYAVDGSSISGQIQIAETAEGNSTVVVTLSNIQAGQRYGLEIFQGDCGPDRPSLIKLNPVPSVPSDPNASWTETSLHYSELAEGNNFIYVYTPDGAVIACGEVGAGALSQ